MSLYPGIVAVSALADYNLLLTFETGERRIFDVKPYLSKGIFSALRDLSVFQSVRIQFDSIEWINGADFDPEMLYAEGKAVDKNFLPDAA